MVSKLRLGLGGLPIVYFGASAEKTGSHTAGTRVTPGIRSLATPRKTWQRALRPMASKETTLAMGVVCFKPGCLGGPTSTFVSLERIGTSALHAQFDRKN